MIVMMRFMMKKVNVQPSVGMNEMMLGEMALEV